MSYGFNENWSVSVRVPVVRRDHTHDLLDEATGLPAGTEHWRFTKLGDVQVLARYQTLANDSSISYALFGGLKLPTGSIDIVNADGSRAERALQPGTGNTDAIAGVAGRKVLGARDALIGQASLTQALNAREDFKPGYRLEVSGGWSHAFSRDLGAVLQVNVRQRGHDSGLQAEPGNSGSTTVDLSPGISLGVGERSTLYAYVQLPLYQKVTGIQLVPRSALALGWTIDF